MAPPKGLRLPWVGAEDIQSRSLVPPCCPTPGRRFSYAAQPFALALESFSQTKTILAPGRGCPGSVQSKPGSARSRG